MARRTIDPAMAWVLSFMIVGTIVGLGYFLLKPHFGESDDDRTALDAMKGGPPPGSMFTGLSVEEEKSAPVTKRWSYSGSTGPRAWGDLHSSYAKCGEGRSQSPVNIRGEKMSSKLLPLRFSYRSAEVALRHTGRTMEAAYESGSYIEVDGVRYDLTQFHFHAPSEHQVDGIPYDMEIHLEHTNSTGAEVTVAVFVEEGRTHSDLSELWAQMPERRGETSQAVGFDASSLLPRTRTYYKYTGSHTTPPCREGVTWIVLTRSIRMSSAQVDKFLGRIRYNARPVQPLGNRTILRSRR